MMNNAVKKIFLYSALTLLSSNALSDTSGFQCNWTAYLTYGCPTCPKTGTKRTGTGPIRATLREANAAAMDTCRQYVANANLPGHYDCNPTPQECMPSNTEWMNY